MNILLEQLVYGSFPFWDRGYDVLARSPGCRPEWVADVLSACQRIGEAPSGATPSPSLFATRLASGPWAIVGVEPQGVDDRGRPGALAFHALLVEARDYRKAGSDPFAFAGALRRDWSTGTTLEARTWTVEAPRPPGVPIGPRALRVVEALARGRRVALEADGPIDALAREVWSHLPKTTRDRASVATWAFGNDNRFDLVALPRLAGVVLDPSYVDPASIDSDPPRPSEAPRPLPLYRRLADLPRPTLPALAVAGVVGVVAAGLAWRSMVAPGTPGLPSHPRPSGPADPGPPVDPEERARIMAGLEDLAERFEVVPSGNPTVLMERISGLVHYRGPTLSADELARLAAESDPDRDLALGWHDRIRAFVDDRPLPPDFARLPLRRQLDLLARSFHLDPPALLDAIPGALADALSREGPVRPTPLAARYPPLSDYARFLGRLPRRSGR